MRKMLGWLAPLALIGAFLAPPVAADSLGLSVQRIDATQFPTVRAYVSVANATGVPITGLTPDAFQVQEDGKPVDGLQVEPIVDSQEPIAAALVIDTSGSMADEGKIDRAREAASAFIDTLGPKDRITIVSFASQVNVVQDYAGDKPSLKAALGTLSAKGETLLYDAVAQSARRQGAQSERRKALIVLTDGEDTKSSASLDSSIAAAVAAASPIYSIGLGSDVKRDVLDRLAAATGGQAVYVADAADLKATLLSIGDQLRRQYVLRYTSKLSANDQPHGLAVQVQYGGQQVTGLGSFTMALPPPITVVGLTLTGPVTGVQHVQVDAPGAQMVQLLVDDQARGSVRAAPFVFDWDTKAETPGVHRVVVRVTDARATAIDKPYTITVAAPAVVATAAPTTGTVATAGPVPTPTSDVSPVGTSTAFVIALIVLLLLLGLGAVYIATRPRERVEPAPKPAVVPAGPVTDDVTWDIGPEQDGDETYVQPSPDGRRSAARLLIARRGERHEVALNEPAMVVGRDDKIGVSINDPLASRQHARIMHDKDQFWIEDLHSLNGTQVNGEAVTAAKRALVNNDRISIGETVLTFVVE